MYKKLLLLVVLIGFSTLVFSEVNPADASKGTLKGFVFDTNANQPLEYATVSMFSIREGKVVNGTITDETGFFKIKNVDFGMYKIDITFIGYKTKTINQVAVRPKSKEVDLGQIELEPAVETLNEAVVVADRPTMTYKLDKKVINVSQQHTSASGTAVEILENFPSVTVDIEGNVSLRGSESFTVLIDNKPTVLDPSDALSQIPASAIENIEVITNPSAKYDPDGTSGIINIITKKNKLQGFNGIVNANLGMYDRYGGDFLINWRKERINIFFGADYNQRNMEGTVSTKNWTEKNNVVNHVLSDGDFRRGRTAYSMRSGFDLTLNPRNSINFEAQVGYHQRIGSNDADFELYTNPVSTNDFYTSIEDSERGGLFYSFNLSYTKKFLGEGHQLYALANYRNRDSDEETKDKFFDINDLQTSGRVSSESGPSNSYRFQLDYTLPLAGNNKFEAGYNARVSLSDEITEMEEYNPLSGLYDYMSDYKHDVSHDDNIHAVYTMYSGEIGKFGYMGGLRGEYTYRNITLNETGESFIIDRFDFFPTIHFSYATKKESQWMVNYSRRIHRPRGWNLEPFYTWRSAYDVRIGNPELIPEYINSFELSHLFKFGRNSFSIDGYYHITDNKIESIVSTYEGSIKQTTFQNVGKDYSLGIEMMLGIDVQKWWHFDLMGNIYDYRVDGEYDYDDDGTTVVVDFSESSFNWNTRLNNTFRLGKTTRIQLNGMYNSPTVSAQGEKEGFFMTNLAVRQSFYKNKVAATLQVRDIFGTMSHSAESEGPNFYSYYDFQPNTPLVTLTLSLKLNNYKPDRKQRSQNGDDDLGGDEEF